MGNITRDRGCCYYVPWIATFCTSFLLAALGVWTYYTNKCKGLTADGLVQLDVEMKHLDKVQPALIATAVTYLVVAFIIFTFSIWRAIIEASHDSTGQTGAGNVAYLSMNAIVNTLWFALVLWLVLLVMADTTWVVLLYVAKQAIKSTLALIAKYGQGTWLPTSGLPCPGNCLNLTMFSWLQASLADACICDKDKLEGAGVFFQEAFKYIPGVEVGILVMLLAGLCLLVNFACQFSHSRRERETLLRANFNEFGAYKTSPMSPAYPAYAR